MKEEPKWHKMSSDVDVRRENTKNSLDISSV